MLIERLTSSSSISNQQLAISNYMVGAEDLKRIRSNPDKKVLLVSFWSTNCAACASQFFDLETTYRMYRLRAFDFITIATDAPDQAPAVLAFLKKQYASSPNKQFASADAGSLQTAWGAKWKPGTPFTMPPTSRRRVVKLRYRLITDPNARIVGSMYRPSEATGRW